MSTRTQSLNPNLNRKQLCQTAAAYRLAFREVEARLRLLRIEARKQKEKGEPHVIDR